MLTKQGIEIEIRDRSWRVYLAGLGLGVAMLTLSIGVAVLLARGCA